MPQAALRNDDSVQFSLNALRKLEDKRVEEERRDRERVQFEQIRRIAAEHEAKQQRLRDEQQLREEAVRAEQMRLRQTQARAEERERRAGAQRQAALEQTRLELALKRAEVEASVQGASIRPSSRWFPAVLAAGVIAAQALFIYYQHQDERAARVRHGVATSEVAALKLQNDRLTTRAATLEAQHTADQAPVAAAPKATAKSKSKSKSKSKVPATQNKQSKHRPKSAPGTTKRPPPKSGQFHFDCDVNGPLCGAR